MKKLSIEETLGKDPAPAAIRYLVLASALICVVTAIAFIPEQVGKSTAEQQFFEFAPLALVGLFGLSMIEWFLLGRSRKILGPYGVSFGVEIIKSLAFYFGTNAYVENVSGGNSNVFFLHQLFSFGILFMLALTKVARTRLDQLAQKDLSRNLLNLLPTLVIFILMFSTYLVEIAGIGVPRQRESFGPYTEKLIDWELFNTPSWDATYLLENLLDQFTSGIRLPNEPLFNVTPKTPPTYWRLGTLGSYEYTGKAPYTTDWNAVATKKALLEPGQDGPPPKGDRGIPDEERTATFTFELPLDYSDSAVEVSVNPSFQNYLPTTWNGKYGAYVDSDSFRLYDADRNPLSASTLQARDIYPDGYRVVQEHLLGIDTNIRVTETSTNEGVFEYSADYYDLLESNMDAMTYSMTKDNYSDILTPLNGYASGTWADIQALYLQLPNTPEELPATAYVGGDLVANPQNYSDWAPFVTGNASECELEGLSVFAQAYADMQRLTPIGVEYQERTELCSEGVTCSELGLLFDLDMWIGTYVNELLPTYNNTYPDYEMPHPEEYEDYNEWFLRRGKGVSIHFASTLATWMRLRGIPSRVVVGYLFGNHTMDPTRLVVTAQNLHAWTEVLIPIDPTPSSTLSGDEYVEWIGFDPLLTCLAARADQELTFDIPSISPLNSTWMINPEWPYKTQNPVEAIVHDLTYPDDPVLWRVLTNDSDKSLYHLDPLNVSVRLMMLTSPNSWIPWQPTCDTKDFEVAFYIGTAANNGTIPGSLIEEQGIPLGNSTLDSAGLATISINYDIVSHGYDDLYFYAVFKVTTECGQSFRRVARSLKHTIVLF